MKLVHHAVAVHGIRWHEEPGPRGLCWLQYWRGVRHTWRWHGIPVWTRLRRRDRPMHEFTRMIAS